MLGTLGPHTVLPVAISCAIIFSWISSMVWNLFPFKSDFRFMKSQKSQGTKSGLWEDWVTWVIWCFSRKLCTTRDAWHAQSGCSCQSPAARSCGFLNHPTSFHRRMFKLNAKFDADWLLYSVSHFECDGHTVPMLTQRRLPPPLTSTVKSSLYMHAHSSPLSLAARLHQCRTNCSPHINNGWAFSRQTLNKKWLSLPVRDRALDVNPLSPLLAPSK